MVSQIEWSDDVMGMLAVLAVEAAWGMCLTTNLYGGAYSVGRKLNMVGYHVKSHSAADGAACRL